jgi:alanine racemase
MPVVGRVSMDLTTVDITDLPGRPPERGDLVELIGPSVSLEETGAAAGTIGYEVLTRLGRRFQRTYIGGHA